MKKKQILELCKTFGPPAHFDPLLILAVCEQESQDPHDEESCMEDATRLENKFFHRYTEKEGLATTSAILLAASYGLMQLMGESLKELGYFEYFRDWYNVHNEDKLNYPLSQVTIVKAIDVFVMNASWQIEWGIKWLDRKRAIAKGDETNMLQFWNGGGNPDYGKEVLEKYSALKQ